MTGAPAFEALTYEEIQDLYRANPRPEIRRLILELVGARHALAQIEAEVSCLCEANGTTKDRGR